MRISLSLLGLVSVLIEWELRVLICLEVLGVFEAILDNLAELPYDSCITESVIKCVDHSHHIPNNNIVVDNHWLLSHLALTNANHTVGWSWERSKSLLVTQGTHIGQDYMSEGICFQI